MTTAKDFNELVNGDYRGVQTQYFRLASILPNRWNYFEHLNWFGPDSLFKDLEENHPEILKMIVTSVSSMIPSWQNHIDVDKIVIRSEPKYDQEKGYDFVYITTSKFTNDYSDMRMSGHENHYALVPLQETYRFDDIYAVLRRQYFEADHATKKIAYGLAYNEILRKWWHGDPIFEIVQSQETLGEKGVDAKCNLDLINNYIPTDIAMDMNADKEYIVFEKVYVPKSEPLAQEYVDLMNYCIDGTTKSASRILQRDDKGDVQVKLNIIH